MRRRSTTGRILLEKMRVLPQVTDVASDQQIASPGFAITVDRNATFASWSQIVGPRDCFSPTPTWRS
jgi:hypothetical protein